MGTPPPFFHSKTCTSLVLLFYRSPGITDRCHIHCRPRRLLGDQRDSEQLCQNQSEAREDQRRNQRLGAHQQAGGGATSSSFRAGTSSRGSSRASSPCAGGPCCCVRR